MTPTNTEALAAELEKQRVSNWVHSTGAPPIIRGTKPDPLCQQAAAELRRLSALCAEWEAKAATWLASPEAAQRLEGYRELGRKCAELEAERDALRAALVRVLGTREREAKAYLTAQVASANFSRRSAKADEHAHLQAAMEASKAEKEARELLAAMKGTQ